MSVKRALGAADCDGSGVGASVESDFGFAAFEMVYLVVMRVYELLVVRVQGLRQTWGASGGAYVLW